MALAPGSCGQRCRAKSSETKHASRKNDFGSEMRIMQVLALVSIKFVS
jgi:hypothetical protein